MVPMSKDDRFWFGKVRYRVLEGKEGVREAYDCMAGVYDFSEYLYWTRRWRRRRRGLLESGLMVFLEFVWMWVVGLGGIRLGLPERVLRLWL